MVQSEVQFLLSLGDSAQELCVSLPFQSLACFLQEGNGLFNVLVLAGNVDCDDSVPDWVQLAGKTLNHLFIQLEKVRVLGRIKCLVLGASDELHTYLVPHLFLVLEGDRFDGV